MTVVGDGSGLTKTGGATTATWDAFARSLVSIGTGNPSWDEEGESPLGKVRGSVWFKPGNDDKDLRVVLTDEVGLKSCISGTSLIAGEHYAIWLKADAVASNPTMDQDGKIFIFEPNALPTGVDCGAWKIRSGTSPVLSDFRIDVDGDEVRFVRSGVVFYTAKRTGTKPLWTKIELFDKDTSTNGSALEACWIHSSTDLDADGMADGWEMDSITSTPAALWTDLTNFSPAADTLDSDGTSNLREYAAQSLPNSNTSGKSVAVIWGSAGMPYGSVLGDKKIQGDGAVWFKPATTTTPANEKKFAIGLNSDIKAGTTSVPVNSAQDLRYGVRLTPVSTADSEIKGSIEVITAGTSAATVLAGPYFYNADSEVGIVRLSGIVTIWLNGVPIYTYDDEEGSSLFVDGYVDGPATTTLESLAVAPPYSECKVITGDNDTDDLPDAWEIANGGIGLFSNAPNADRDQDGLLDVEEFHHGTSPATFTSSSEAGVYARKVNWTRFRDTTVSGDKGGLSSATAAGDAQGSIAIHEDGILAFKLGQNTKKIVLGLGKVNASYAETDILYGFSAEANGTLKLRLPDGSTLSGIWRYHNQTWFRLEVTESEVRYVKDNVVIHTEPRESGEPLWCDVSFSANTTASQAVISEAWLYSKSDTDADVLPDSWEISNHVGSPDWPGASLKAALEAYTPGSDTDTANADGASQGQEWALGTDANNASRGGRNAVNWSISGENDSLNVAAVTTDAVSNQRLLADGCLWFTPGKQAGTTYIGLNSGNAAVSRADIDYAVQVTTSSVSGGYQTVKAWAVLGSSTAAENVYKQGQLPGCLVG